MADLPDIKYLEQLLILMRAQGVDRFTIGDLGVTFAASEAPAPAASPHAPPPPVAAPLPPAEPDEDLCACGHSVEIHHSPTDGFPCLVCLCPGARSPKDVPPPAEPKV